MNTPAVPIDPSRVGISYSGGGPLLAVELGIARAFVQSGIRPAIISGASAGAIAAAAHALCYVIHIHPEGTTALQDFNFTPALVKQAVDEACELTLTWLAGNPTT